MPAIPPTRVGIKLTFSFGWRGTTKLWSQLYHFDGPTSWASQAQFDTCVVALWNIIKICIPSRVTLVEATAYNAGSFLPVYTHTFGATGTYTDSANPQAAGEMCMLWKMTTDQRSTKNHPIYLFKWFHGMQSEGATSPDTLRAGIQSTAAGQLTSLLAGINDGTNTRKYCGPRGAVAQSGSVNTLLHAREFPT